MSMISSSQAVPVVSIQNAATWALPLTVTKFLASCAAGDIIFPTPNGLPPNFLKEYNHDRSWDFMAALLYFPVTETENNGITEHEDGNCVTFVFQDQVGGLQVRKNGEWNPVTPAQDTLVVNLGDVIQVLSNNKFKSATHRVVRQQGKSRYSYAFFYNLHGDKRVEPLSKFTEEIGEEPKYRGFLYKDYQAMRMRNKTHPPAKPEDVIHITHYAITS
ncbi:hypothetical protein Ddye_002607 [Dipteronia dyeriana]|uniref:Fe2OG dioxygenase domain-containing protein n=1 Tax=Dipteronia dyeriana TaxID=168575 RepID=A0AAE0CV58_9ROSI|nr:hypothetical protein Ddye_002607 [Dipteronia dyeriana]